MKRKTKSNNRDFRKWVETLRRSLKNIKTISKIFKVHYVYENGEISVNCPEMLGEKSVLNINKGTFCCGCGYRGKSDVFAFLMHLDNLTFGRVLHSLSESIQYMTPQQGREQSSQRLRRKHSRESEF